MFILSAIVLVGLFVYLIIYFLKSSPTDEQKKVAKGVGYLIPIVGVAFLFTATLQMRENARLSPEDQARCERDSKCYGDQLLGQAAFACSNEIEKKAKFSFKWADGSTASRLQRITWANKEETVLAYFGDKVMFQNGFGAWQNILYQCNFDPVRRQVVRIGIQPGRL